MPSADRRILRRPLKRAKLSILRWSRRLGLFAALRNSQWRHRRLLILCYHGVSLEDEHRWNPCLYMSPADLRARLETLRRGKYNVLPLEEGIRRLYARTLPPRSIVLTFDDGYVDFYAAAWPLLCEFSYPATVYLTTFRCGCNLPTFNLVVPYMLWKRRDAVVDAPGFGTLDLRTDDTRRQAWSRLQHASARLGPLAKHRLAGRISDEIGGDYAALVERRLLTVMPPEYVTELSRQGVDVQLHTHRHRTPQDRVSFDDEITTNRERIAQLTGRSPSHFCYPSGVYRAELLPWLRAAGIRSATTCDPGFATERGDALLLPRLVDHEGLSVLEFEAWLTGVAALTARKAAAYRRPAASLPDTVEPATPFVKSETAL